MEKVYIKPAMRLVEIDTTGLLAQSFQDGYGFGGPNLPSAVKSRKNWDDDEEEW